MSTFGRPLTDDGLIRVLDHWLDDGPVVAPDLMVESALRMAAWTPQRRWRGRLLNFASSSPLLPVGLTLAAIAAVVTLGFGIGQVLPLPGTEATPTPGFTDAPTPAPVPEGMRLYTDAALGFSVVIPADWEAYPLRAGVGNAGAVIGFGESEEPLNANKPAVYVSVGTTEGEVAVCNLGRNCEQVRATNLEELAQVAEGIRYPGQLGGIPQVHVDRNITLGGGPARYEGYEPCRCAAGVAWLNHVLAMHAGRPIVVGFDHYTFDTPLSFRERQIIDSFRFLEVATYPWVGGQHGFPAEGFEISIPRSWSIYEDGKSIHMRGNGTSLTIRVGDPDGQLSTCEQPARPWERCRDAQITNLDEFREAVTVGPPPGCDWCVPPGWPGGPSTLAGEDAVDITFHGYEYPAQGAESARYVLAIHEGRPYFIRFHTSAERAATPPLWDEMLETFAFMP